MAVTARDPRELKLTLYSGNISLTYRDTMVLKLKSVLTAVRCMVLQKLLENFSILLLFTLHQSLLHFLSYFSLLYNSLCSIFYPTFLHYTLVLSSFSILYFPSLYTSPCCIFYPTFLHYTTSLCFFFYPILSFTIHQSLLLFLSYFPSLYPSPCSFFYHTFLHYTLIRAPFSILLSFTTHQSLLLFLSFFPSL